MKLSGLDLDGDLWDDELGLLQSGLIILIWVRLLNREGAPSPGPFFSLIAGRTFICFVLTSMKIPGVNGV